MKVYLRYKNERDIMKNVIRYFSSIELYEKYIIKLKNSNCFIFENRII